MDAGLVATIRRTRGDDIDAACGQLAGQVKDRTTRRLARTHHSRRPPTETSPPPIAGHPVRVALLPP